MTSHASDEMAPPADAEKESSPPSERRGFHVRFKPLSMLLAILAGVGYLILLQQYGMLVVTTGKILLAVGMGLVAGIVIPSLATLIPHKQKPAQGDA